MSSTRPALAAERRTITGKAVAGLRRDGRLPAVVYGHGVESASVSLDAHEFDTCAATSAATPSSTSRSTAGRRSRSSSTASRSTR